MTPPGKRLGGPFPAFRSRHLIRRTTSTMSFQIDYSAPQDPRNRRPSVTPSLAWSMTTSSSGQGGGCSPICEDLSSQAWIGCRNVALPPEILLVIFRYLENRSDLYRCSLTCQYWNACALMLLWRDPCPFGSENEDDATPQSHNRTTRTAPSAFSSSSLSSPSSHTWTASSFPLLDSTRKGWMRSLWSYLRSVRHVGGGGSVRPRTPVQRWASFLSALQSSRDAWKPFPIVQLGSCIRALDLSSADRNNVDITDQELLIIMKHCAWIQRLNLTSCTNVTDSAILALTRSPCGKPGSLRFFLLTLHPYPIQFNSIQPMPS